MRSILLFAVLAAACADKQPAAVAPMSSSSSPSPSPPTSAPPLQPLTAAGSGSKSSCLMVNVCECNLGCAKVPLAGDALKVGAQAKVEKGPHTGELLKVVEVTDKTGLKVLALTDRGHDQACEAPTKTSRSLMGYACEASKSGPVPAHACASACD